MPDMDTALEAHGYDPRFTPIDTLMNGPLSMHLDAADAMENGFEYDTEE